MFRKSVILMALCVAVLSSTAAAAPSANLNDLLAAYKGEKNAQVRYVLFAQQADKEWLKLSTKPKKRSSCSKT